LIGEEEIFGRRGDIENVGEEAGEKVEIERRTEVIVGNR
jgi:hypothetical protein